MTDYWDTVGATKTFTHPLHTAWLAGVGRTARVLDYGCGYGRLTAQLSDLGFADVTGVDISAALIARGRRARPDLRLAVIDSPPVVDEPAGSFDLVTLFAVLTCVPGDDDQRALIAEVRRVLRPGGLLYVSDLLLQDDERHRRRYAEHFAKDEAGYGVFATGDGAVCRHHDAGHLRGLLGGFDLLDERHLEVTTMNGRRASAVQMLALNRR
ncbi:MAG: class I SAM-dependent methyltransferase [Actinoplanes sp.]